MTSYPTTAASNTAAAGRLIYGCMGLGGTWDDSPYGAFEVDQAAAAIDAALQAGIRLFDHADIYRLGKSNKPLARFSPILRDCAGSC